MARPLINVTSGNRNLVLAQVLCQPKIARSEISASLGLNMASVSRISRELIDAGLLREAELEGVLKRPGRRSIGLEANGGGGFVVGIGLNAFRQTVTLANLANEKVAEWVSPTSPGSNGEAFLRLCLTKAKEMVEQHVPERHRFFGVGVAVSANLDIQAGLILDAPTFGWTKPILVRDLVAEILDVPLALETPSSAINQSEAEFGIGRGYTQVATLYCSLGFGLGVRKQGDQRHSFVDFGRVLTQSPSPDSEQPTLDLFCGGMSILGAVHGIRTIAGLSETERSHMLSDIIATSDGDPSLQELLAKKGQMTALGLALVFDVLRPDLLLLAGPLALSRHYVDAFSQSLAQCISDTGPMPQTGTSKLTPTGASRWLALRANVAFGDLDLPSLTKRSAA